jgi:hypothetical protein
MANVIVVKWGILPTYLPYSTTFLPTYLLTYLRIYLLTIIYQPSYLRTYYNLPTYLPTFVFTYLLQPTYLPTHPPTYLPIQHIHLPTHTPCRDPSLRFATKARAYKGAGQKWSSRVTFHVPRNVGRCEEMNPHVPKWAPNLGILGQNDIWVQAIWPNTENSIRGKVMASPKSKPWWVLWVHVCVWPIRAPKMLQPCTNQLIIWFVQVCVNNWPTCHLF